MKNFVLMVLCAMAVLGCKSKSTLQSEDKQYISTAVDLIRTRALITASKDTTAMDSNRVRLALDSVYSRHQTTRQQFIDWTLRLSEDPNRATAFFDAVSDSIGKK